MDEQERTVVVDGSYATIEASPANFLSIFEASTSSGRLLSPFSSISENSKFDFQKGNDESNDECV